MLFRFNDETFHAPAGCGLLAGFGYANAHFGNRLPRPGSWMDGKDEPNEWGGKTRTFYWAEGNFSD